MWDNEYRDIKGIKLKEHEIRNLKNWKRCVKTERIDVDELDNGKCGWHDELFEDYKKELIKDGWEETEVEDFSMFGKGYQHNGVFNAIVKRHYFKRNKVYYLEQFEEGRM